MHCEERGDMQTRDDLASPLLDGEQIPLQRLRHRIPTRPISLCSAVASMVVLLGPAALWQAGKCGKLSFLPTVQLPAVNPYVNSRRQLRVLVTGYDLFDNATVNPAALVAEALNGTCGDSGVCVEGWVLSVDTSGASRVEKSLTARHRASGSFISEWDAVIHLGLEASSKGLRIELAAANVLAVARGQPGAGVWSAEVPCNKSGTVYREIHPGAPCLLASTIPLDQVTMQDGPTPPLPLELWSRDAGTFFCNEILYRTLHAIRSLHLQPVSWPARGSATEPRDAMPLARLLPAVFIHLPLLSTADVATSSAFVRRAAELMVGVRPAAENETSTEERKLLGNDADQHGCHASAGYIWCATTSRCMHPWEEGPCAVAGVDRSLRVRAGVGPSGSYLGSLFVLGATFHVAVDVDTNPRLVNLSVTSTPALAAFQCPSEEWDLDKGRLLHIVPDECWERNVVANLEELQIRYDLEEDAIVLRGFHRIVLYPMPLKMTLYPVAALYGA